MASSAAGRQQESVPWSVRLGMNAVVTACSLLTVFLVAMRLDGTIGGPWGVVLIPLWVLCLVLFAYSLLWLSVLMSDRDNHQVYVYSVDQHSRITHMADAGPLPIFQGVQYTHADQARNNGVISVLRAMLSVSLAPVLLLTGILAAIRLGDASSMSALTAASPLVIWLSVCLVPVVIGPLWTRGIVGGQ